ncbi:MAG: hypothetical protein K2Y56_16000 [Methylobacterium sp.]|uniref:hypothetical protein n=1 Tax=Methylobacterium sp. TaxID=409 RepID=UPI0025E9011F|nr:hypothetical protein [Methylobacterium sp.]MBX9933017.1 hypothetical protein [Methylobacterium sp.]
MAQQTITALFDRYEDASAAVTKLESIGIPHSDISIVANNESDRHSSLIGHGDGNHREAKEGAETGAGTGASLGTIAGGALGLLTGLGLMAIPGVGPVVAAGWLVTTITGAGIGAAAGGLIGGLTGAGVNEADAQTYSEGVRRGGTLVTVRVDEARSIAAMDILEQHGSVDVDERAQTWRSEGWASPATSEIGAPTGSAAGTGLTSAGIVEGRPRVRSYASRT